MRHGIKLIREAVSPPNVGQLPVFRGQSGPR
jgi:hypothetical protein